MSTARYIVGDVIEQLRKLPDDSVDLVFSSPPFLALRSYLPPDHPDKAKEIGSEPTPGDFLDALLDVTEECARVLTPHGSLCFELGDTYSGSGGHGGDYAAGGLRDGQPKFEGAAAQSRQPRSPRPKYADVDGGPLRNRTIDTADGIIPPTSHSRKQRPGWAQDKSLSLIPELYRVALAYGFNPLTGRQTDSWKVRNVIRWCRPNPPVGALGDKVRPATSDVVMACKARDRYFDLDAIREPGIANTHPRLAKRDRETVGSRRNNGKAAAAERGGNHSTLDITDSDGTAPPLDHWWIDDTFDQDAWLIPTAPYKGSHYATFPPALVVKPVLAMCPERVCTVCGEPSRRIAETTNAIGEATGRRAWRDGDTDGIGGGHVGDITWSSSSAPSAERHTLGWTDCGHDSWRNGVVLDPFAGSGTTLAVATGHGRDGIGIDLDERNAHLAQERVGMFLTVEWPEAAA